MKRVNKRSDVRFLWAWWGVIGMLVLTRPVSVGFGTYVYIHTCMYSAFFAAAGSMVFKGVRGGEQRQCQEYEGGILLFTVHFSHFNYKNIEYPVCYILCTVLHSFSYQRNNKG